MNSYNFYVGMIVCTTSGHQQGVFMKIWAMDDTSQTATLKAINGMLTVHMTFEDYPVSKLRPFHIQAGDYIRQKTFNNSRETDILEVMDMYPKANGHEAIIRVFNHNKNEIQEIYLQHYKQFLLCSCDGSIL